MGTINRLPISTVNPNDLALLAEDPDYFLAAKSGRLYRVDGEPIIGDAEAAATRAEAAADAAEAALAVIEAQAYRDPSSATIVAGQSDYPLGYEPGEDRLDVSLNGSVLLHGTDYSIVDGDTLRLLDASYYAQAGGTLVWKGGAQMPYSPDTLPHFDTFAAFSAANVEPPLNTASIAGQLVVADATGPIQAANLRKWAPAGGRFDIRLAATASALASDFGGIASQWMLDCAMRGWTGFIGPSDDPYEWNRIEVAIANDLRLDLTGANLYPKTDFNDFTCDGVTNSFTLGSWFSGNLSDCSSVYITGDRTYTGALTDPSTQFSVVSGNTIQRTAGAPAGGQTLRIGNRWQAWRITSSNRSRVWLRGGYVDLGRRGYVPTRASGSAFGFQSTGPVYWDGAPVVTNSGGDFTGTLLNQRSDSAIVFNDVQTKYVEGLIAQGMGDLAIYDTGGADTLSGADDGFGLNIIGGDFYRCTNGVKMVRQGASMNMTGTNMRQCVTGIINSDIGASDAGRNFIIHAHFFDIARRALDLRNTDSLRGRVTIEDWGYLPNGTGWTNQSGTDDSTAISLSDCLGVSLDVEIHNRLRTKKASRPAIQIASGTAQGNRITATIRNASTGLRETGGSGSTEFGGRYDLTCIDVDTPCVLSSASNSRVTVSQLTGTPVSGEVVISNHPVGMTRPDAVTAHAQGLRIPNGRVVDIGGLQYRGSTGATAISDLPGLVPVAPFNLRHWYVSGDARAALQAAVDYLGSLGGGDLNIDPGVYEVSDTITISRSGVAIKGPSRTANRPTPSATNIRAAATVRIVASAAFSTDGRPVVLFQTAAGLSRQIGGGVQGITIDGLARAQIALQVKTWEGGTFKDLGLIYATAAQLDLDVITTATLPAGSIYDVQYCTFDNIYCTAINSPACNNAYGLRTRAFENVGNVNPDPVPLSINNPNVSYNQFKDCVFISTNVPSTWLEGCTDNTFINCATSVISDIDQVSIQGWQFLSADQDSRLNATCTKRNLLIKCAGRVYARAGQTGRLSSQFNRLLNHVTHTRWQFVEPVVYEAPAGGSRPADLRVQNDFADMGTINLMGEFTNIETRRSYMGLTASKTVVAMTGGVTSVTVAGAIPKGAVVVGVTARVTTALVGVTGFLVGTAADNDRFGAATNFVLGTNTDNTDWTVGTIELFTAATDIVISRNGVGTFTAGAITLCVYYFLAVSEHS